MYVRFTLLLKTFRSSLSLSWEKKSKSLLWLIRLHNWVLCVFSDLITYSSLFLHPSLRSAHPHWPPCPSLTMQIMCLPMAFVLIVRSPGCSPLRQLKGPSSLFYSNITLSVKSLLTILSKIAAWSLILPFSHLCLFFLHSIYHSFI